MNKLKEIFDQLKDILSVRWEQFQESDTYIGLRDRYDNLSPRNQKFAIFATFFIAFLIVFLIPFSWFNDSRDSVVQFEDTKSSIQELLEVSQEAKSIPAQSDEGLSSNELKTKIDKLLAEKGMTKEQIVSVIEGQFTNPAGSNLIPAQILPAGVDVNLKKLNIKQVVDMGYELEHIASTVKLLNLDVMANKDDVHYYDVGYRVATFSVKETSDKKGLEKNKRPVDAAKGKE